MQVIQGSQSDSVMMLNSKLSNIRTTSNNYEAMFHTEATKAAATQQKLDEYTRYEDMTPAVSKEMKALFPSVREVSVALTETATPDTTAVVRNPTVLVGLSSKARLGTDELRKMKEWLAVRVGANNVRLITYPESK